MVSILVEDIRQRFTHLTKGKNVELILDLPAHPLTCYKFRRGGVVSLSVLEKIEAWCDAQENKS